MTQLYIVRFRDDPLVMGVSFKLCEGEDLLAAAVDALSLHTDHHALDETWEIRIAGPFPIGPERIELIHPKDFER